MTDIIVEEFLYRGRFPDEGADPAWHLVLAARGTDTFGATFVDRKTYNIEQAQAAGWPLPTVIAAINSTLTVLCEQQQAKIVDLQQQIAALTEAAKAQ